MKERNSAAERSKLHGPCCQMFEDETNESLVYFLMKPYHKHSHAKKHILRNDSFYSK